ncbi:type II toxin-antitoxin system PemK/MazF family toxin [Desulfobacca acetoxidans]
MAPGVIRRGSIVLVKYPFTDLSAQKLRPALILTPDSLLQRLDEAIFLFISSVIPDVALPPDYILTTDHQSFSATGLKRSSIFRAHKIITLHKTMAACTPGDADVTLMRQITHCLARALGMQRHE